MGRGEYDFDGTISKDVEILIMQLPEIQLYRSKLVYPDGAIREMVIWGVPESPERPHGLKYRLYYGSAQGKCMVRYDNETGKGDHRHHMEKEKTYHFVDVETLIGDFQKDINWFRRQKNE